MQINTNLSVDTISVMEVNDSIPKEDYNEDPVFYCANCYSLKIKQEEATGLDYCAECGSLDILEAPITTWERLYEIRYGKKYTKVGRNPKKEYVFKLPIDSLKAKVYECPAWRAIIYSLYPYFPKKLGKTESILRLFEKLIKDNRIDALRLELMKYIKI